jgi:hypothetical protein
VDATQNPSCQLQVLHDDIEPLAVTGPIPIDE